MMDRILWGGVTLFVIVAFIVGVMAAAGCDPLPAQPSGVELDVDVDRAKTRAPIKTRTAAPAPVKTRKVVKR